MEEKLADETTYMKIERDPTYEIKDEISKKLKEIEEEGEINNGLYLRLLPRKTQIPRMYGLPKIHKEGYPLREIVDGSGGVTRDLNKYISKIIKVYAGDNEYSMNNSQHFAAIIKDEKLEEGELLCHTMSKHYIHQYHKKKQ